MKNFRNKKRKRAKSSLLLCYFLRNITSLQKWSESPLYFIYSFLSEAKPVLTSLSFCYVKQSWFWLHLIKEWILSDFCLIKTKARSKSFYSLYFINNWKVEKPITIKSTFLYIMKLAKLHITLTDTKIKSRISINLGRRN